MPHASRSTLHRSRCCRQLDDTIRRGVLTNATHCGVRQSTHIC